MKSDVGEIKQNGINKNPSICTEYPKGQSGVETIGKNYKCSEYRIN